MKKMKQRLLCLLTAAGFALGAAACGNAPREAGETNTAGNAAEAQAGDTAGNEAAGAVLSADDLPGKRIGVQLGTTGDIYVSDYESDGSGTAVERYNKGADAVQALKQGKIDCVVIDEEPALNFVEQNPGLRVLPEEFTLEEYAFVVGKGNDGLVDAVNAALSELEEEGVLDEIKKN